MKRIAAVLVSGLTVAGCIPKRKAPGAHENKAPPATSVSPGARPASPGENVPAIKVNTVGYPLDWPKQAVFNVPPKGAVVENEAGDVIYEFTPETLTEHGVDECSGDAVWQGDFSTLRRKGVYRIRVGDERSDPFVINEAPFRETLNASQKMFYFQRSRTPLVDPYATWKGNSFTRSKAPHQHDQVGWDMETYPERTKRFQPVAGWHDAGNFDMYVPSTAPTAQGLLMAYERAPTLFKDGQLNLPESQNGVPDLLDEAMYGIQWVFSMQAPTGGYHLRETTITQSEVTPGPADQDLSVRWIDRVGSASTAKGCALAALTSRIYEEHNPEFAATARAQAKASWKWLREHPERVQVPPVGAAVENEYLLWDDGKEVASDVGARFNAAAEVWVTFRDPEALTLLTKLLEDPETGADKFAYTAWTNLTRWGMERLAFDEESPAEIREVAKHRLLEAAEALLQVAKKDGYLCASKASDYYWGSNSNLLERAQLLLVAERLSKRVEFLHAAQDQFHWILGRNPNGFSMVTQIGKSPTAMYHLEWGPHSPELPPGYLVGGPNHENMKFLSPNAPAKALLWEAPHDLSSGSKAGSLWHWQQSDLWDGGLIAPGTWNDGWWAVTEPDIYYNMNLVLVATQMQ